MDKLKETLICIDSDDFSTKELVSILVLVESKLDILTISRMARSEGLTPRGVTISDRFKKIKIGGQTMAIKGLKNDKFPF